MVWYIERKKMKRLKRNFWSWTTTKDSNRVKATCAAWNASWSASVFLSARKRTATSFQTRTRFFTGRCMICMGRRQLTCLKFWIVLRRPSITFGSTVRSMSSPSMLLRAEINCSSTSNWALPLSRHSSSSISKTLVHQMKSLLVTSNKWRSN